MDNQDWVILHTLFAEKNITKTADKLRISQPALTYRLQQLEQEFEIKIVHRGRRGVAFTPQGEHLVKYADEMLLQLRKTKEYLQNMDTKVQGTLRLGVSSIFARYKLPTILKNFHSQYPDVDFNVTTGWSEEVINHVYQQKVHIGIIRGDYNFPFQRKLLLEENMCIVSQKQIDINDLPNLPRIYYNTDTSLKKLIDNWWHERYSHPPLITMEVDKMETCKEMVLNGLGYAILPNILLNENEDLFIAKCTTLDGVPLIRRTWMVLREEDLEISIIKSFVNFLEKWT
ncbi:LysR family transcriptional regulator [Ammoniphilus sp. CFH 90114]|uniref:LysR family transcriptional regulator n=1 Tax=Ammoniphilus sp. CFH 90114 TaxID=2493665 RepID=UPI00100FE346|nr:LysR family transcriptional regulator [Ammoniphilus sp. CFH 90114]RXT00681.1 LysR family transcriptional regulator [Ammoniphilus sp. CFH 90114]